MQAQVPASLKQTGSSFGSSVGGVAACAVACECKLVQTVAKFGKVDRFL